MGYQDISWCQNDHPAAQYCRIAPGEEKVRSDGMDLPPSVAGLLAGKFAGIYFFTWLVIKMGFAGLLKGMTWVNLTGVCLLGGIGFTVSLFIANLSFGDSPVLLTQAKMGVILGTVLAGVLAYLVLQFALPKQPAQE